MLHESTRCPQKPLKPRPLHSGTRIKVRKFKKSHAIIRFFIDFFRDKKKPREIEFHEFFLSIKIEKTKTPRR